MDAQAHWNDVYASQELSEVSWYQPNPETSMRFIRRICKMSARVVDIGAGASTLVDALLAAGYIHPTALDISAAGLGEAQTRLGPRSRLARWIVADVTKDPVLPEFDLWHDRAVLHFLTQPNDQRDYARLAARSVRPGGHVVIATFAPDGPQRCSGLPVRQHNGASIASLLGADFDLLAEEREVHLTPSGSEQRFCWSVLRRL